jgi:hypothetical protein
MDNEKRYIVEQIAAKLMKSCTIHDSGLFICTLNKELDKYHQSELLKLNKSDVISSVCECKRLENGKIVMCQKCLVDLTEIE